MPSPVEAGTVLAGKYRVDRVLGEGGMGVVVAATDLQLERRVAIKFLLPEYLQHKEATQRFLREARSCVKIQSEHVARVIDVGTMDTGAPYMVMEFLEGQDLSGLLSDRKTLPAEEAVAYVLEACDAIAEAHSVGIVHRDLKPANLFLARQPDGSARIKVLDFGISKATMTGGATDPSLTRTSSMMGSPLYMSPEQMKSAKNVDPRTDVWALGVILYELLHGEPPFYAESIPELSAKVLLEEPSSIRSRRADVPEALEAVVMKALAKNVDARFPTVADLAIALGPFGPARTRANVERASRVLRVTGGVLAPAAVAATTAGPGPVASYAQTAAAWAETGGEAKKKAGKGPLMGVAALLVAGLAGGGIFLATRAPAPAPEPPAAASPPAPPVAAPPAELGKVEPEPAEPAKPAAVTATVQVAPPSPSASVASSPITAAPAPRLPAKKPAPARPPAKAGAGAPAPAPASPSDPFGGFGSRK